MAFVMAAGQRPQAEVRGDELERRIEANRLEDAVASGQELQVGDVAARRAAPAQVRIVDPAQALPPEYLFPPSVVPFGEGPPAIGKDRFERRLAARHGLPRRDADLDPLDALESTGQSIDDGRGDRGQRARAARHQHAAAARGGVERADAGDKGAAIGQIDIVRACRDGSLGDVIGLPLKRPRSVDDEIGTTCCQRRGEILRIVIDRNGLANRRRPAELADKAGSARRVSSRDAEPDFFFGGQ
jgi:hypothetical protein